MNKSIVLAVGAVAAVFLSGQAWSQDVKAFKLKHRSSFTLQDTERNPFWPVGWVKTAPTAVASNDNVQVSEIRAEDFELTAILLGTPPMAVINGKEYAEGEYIIIRGGGPKTKVLVAQVLDGRVVLRYMNRDYPVALRRRGEETGIKKAQPSPTPTPME
ncbi:MAG: hypothetical protein WCH43_04245 [Verrucomicrobiota bacterium]